MERSSALLKLEHIYKYFGGNRALNDVGLELHKGEVLSVIGENGAGKSTLMKIIAGALQPDAGEIKLEGEPVRLQSPMDAKNAGISIIYQEPNIFSDLSVLENIFIGNEIKKGVNLDWSEMYAETCKSLELVDVPVETASKKMGDLPIGTQQLVMIARGLHGHCKILILDEPTSVLSYGETEKLFGMIENLKRQGVSIIYISHRIAEVLRISDRIMVMRDGNVSANDILPAQASQGSLVEAMSGREINLEIFQARNLEHADVALKVEKLSKAGMFQDIDFTVHAGEILGFYGLVGAGRSEIAQAIFGEIPFDSGAVFLDGEPIVNHTPKQAIQRRIHYMPEDRGTQGLFAGHSVADNMSVAFLDSFSGPLYRLNKQKEAAAIEENIKKYRIKVADRNMEILSLSGGNQQKVLFCRWLMEMPHVLILDEPTRGIDIATKIEIHEYIIELAKRGVAVIVISSDLPEVMSLSDLMVVMYRGQIKAVLDRSELEEKRILSAALGL